MGDVDLSRKSFLCLAGASLAGHAATSRETTEATSSSGEAAAIFCERGISSAAEVPYPELADRLRAANAILA